MIVDFHHYYGGLDVADFFSGERELWEFWEFFNRLPDGSFSKSAMADDPEIAEMRVANVTDEDIQRILDARSSQSQQINGVPVVGYTLEIEKLNQIIDALNINTFTIRSIFGGKKNNDQFKEVPRPKSAYDKLLEKRIHAYEKQEQENTMKQFGF